MNKMLTTIANWKIHFITLSLLAATIEHIEISYCKKPILRTLWKKETINDMLTSNHKFLSLCIFSAKKATKTTK